LKGTPSFLPVSNWKEFESPSGGSAWRSTELLGFEYTAGGAFHFCPLLTWKESHPAFGG
jgi:hypothetical protein